MDNILKLAQEFEHKISIAQDKQLEFYKENYEYLIKLVRTLGSKIEKFESYIKDRDVMINNLEDKIEKQQVYINQLHKSLKAYKDKQSGYKY